MATNPTDPRAKIAQLYAAQEAEQARIEQARSRLVDIIERKYRTEKERDAHMTKTDLAQLLGIDPKKAAYCSTDACESLREAGYTLPGDLQWPIIPSNYRFNQQAPNLPLEKMTTNDFGEIPVIPGDILQWISTAPPLQGSREYRRRPYHMTLAGRDGYEYYSPGGRDEYERDKIIPEDVHDYRYNVWRYVGELPKINKELEQAIANAKLGPKEAPVAPLPTLQPKPMQQQYGYKPVFAPKFQSDRVPKYQNGTINNDSTLENILEFVDFTGYLSHDDARAAYNAWQQSNRPLPSLSESLDMFGAVPALGKLGKLKYLADIPDALKPVYKYFPWQQVLNALDTVWDVNQDNISNKPAFGPRANVPKYQTGTQPGRVLSESERRDWQNSLVDWVRREYGGDFQAAADDLKQNPWKSPYANQAIDVLDWAQTVGSGKIENPSQFSPPDPTSIGNAYLAEAYEALQGRPFDPLNPLFGQSTTGSYPGGQRTLSEVTGTSGIPGFMLDMIDPGMIIPGATLAKAGIKGLTKAATKTAAKQAPELVYSLNKNIPQRKPANVISNKPLAEDMQRFEKYVESIYPGYADMPDFRKRRILNDELIDLKTSGVSIDDRIAANSRLQSIWDGIVNERLQYFDSPKFAERVRKQYPGIDDKSIEASIEDLKSNLLTTRPLIRPSVLPDGTAAAYRPYYWHNRPDPNMGPPVDPLVGRSIFRDTTVDPYTIRHENRHQLTNAQDETLDFASQEDIAAALTHPDIINQGLLENLFSDQPAFMPFVFPNLPKTNFNKLLPQQRAEYYNKIKNAFEKNKHSWGFITDSQEKQNAYNNALQDVFDRASERNDYYTRPVELPAYLDELRGELFNYDYDYRIEDATPQLLTTLAKDKLRTENADRVLKWFPQSFILDQLNNRWATVPLAAGAAAAASNEVPKQQMGTLPTPAQLDSASQVTANELDTALNESYGTMAERRRQELKDYYDNTLVPYYINEGLGVQEAKDEANKYLYASHPETFFELFPEAQATQELGPLQSLYGPILDKYMPSTEMGTGLNYYDFTETHLTPKGILGLPQTLLKAAKETRGESGDPLEQDLVSLYTTGRTNYRTLRPTTTPEGTKAFGLAPELEPDIEQEAMSALLPKDPTAPVKWRQNPFNPYQYFIKTEFTPFGDYRLVYDTRDNTYSYRDRYDLDQVPMVDRVFQPYDIYGKFKAQQPILPQVTVTAPRKKSKRK